MPSPKSSSPQHAKGKRARCSNCLRTHRFPGQAPCVLQALLDVRIESGDITPSQARTLMTTVDADFLWTDLGPLVDAVVRGEYSARVSQ